MKNAENEEKKSRKKTVIIVSVIVVILLLAVAVLAVYLNRNSKDGNGLYSSYEMTVESGDNNETNFSMVFDKSAKTYEEKLEASDKTVTLSSGSYEEKDGVVTATSEKDNKAQTFAVMGKYLIATDYLYDGKIPDGDTFETKCSYVNENDAEYSITFRQDGTYTLDADGDTTDGTYKRVGNLIKRTDDSSEGTIDYLIYNDQITNSYYIAK